jgi:hypothetical protein
MIVVDSRGHIAVFEDSPLGAAHSMDTDWYAVDANGRVGYMQSGEEGSVPWNAHRSYWSQLFTDVVVARITSTSPNEPWSERAAIQRALDASSDPVERALARGILDGDDASRDVYIDWLQTNNKVIEGFPRDHVILRVDSGIRQISVDDLPEQWDCVLRFSHPEYLAMFRDEAWRYGGKWRALDERLGMPDTAAVTELYNYGFLDFWEAGELETVYVIGNEYELSPHTLGLYEYSCSFNGPYHRQAIPKHPLLIENVPDPLRTTLEALRIPRRFDALEQFDPDSFFDCQHYGG